MINTLEIKNFKSIKDLRLDCRRVNVFIGEPNTGKSNILEALGLFSWIGYADRGAQLSDLVRMEQTANLFTNQEVGQPIEMTADALRLTIEFRGGSFQGSLAEDGNNLGALSGDHTGLAPGPTRPGRDRLEPFRSFRFQPLRVYERGEPGPLLPPHGPNLLTVVLTSKELRTLVSDLLSPTGLTLRLRPHERRMEVERPGGGMVVVGDPYSLLSDTMQRIIFHMVAIRSNTDSVLTFEEPESHAFPYYTKYLAECIALDDRGNQFFMTTHNPYFLEPLIAKTPLADLAVFLTYMEDFETKVTPLGKRDIERTMETDVFFSVESFLKKR